jgi:MerC mercury resistance protein
VTPRSVPLADSAGAAIGCALHCLLAPWLVTVLPLLTPIVASERTEAALLIGSLSVSGATLLSARLRAHTCWNPVRMFAVAAVALAASRAMGVAEHVLGHTLVAAAACLITAAHCANVRCCRDAERAHCYRGPLDDNAMVATESPAFTGGPANPYIAYPSAGARTCSSSRPR